MEKQVAGDYRGVVVLEVIDGFCILGWFCVCEQVDESGDVTDSNCFCNLHLFRMKRRVISDMPSSILFKLIKFHLPHRIGRWNGPLYFM